MCKRCDSAESKAIAAALEAPLPGWPAQMRMLPLPRASRQWMDGPPRESAVLLVLFRRHSETCLLLTRRSYKTRFHKGQISLPGGARDPDDAALWQTALREAHEEVGLEPTSVALLGQLSPLYVPASNFRIHPFVGWVERPPEAWRIAPIEVTEYFELPLRVLCDAAAQSEESWQLSDRMARVPMYCYESHSIWGATAMILSEFQVLLSGTWSHTRGGA